MPVVAQEEVNEKLTLWRGDYLHNYEKIKTFGIHAEERWIKSGLPSEKWVSLKISSPKTLLFIAEEEVLKHVSKSKLKDYRSPFVSFTGKKEIAKKYAFGIGSGEERRKGVLIEVKLTVLKKCYYPFEGVLSLHEPAVWVDNTGRRWIYLKNVPLSFTVQMEHRNLYEEFYNKTPKDDEVLLLGDLHSHELSAKVIER